MALHRSRREPRENLETKGGVAEELFWPRRITLRRNLLRTDLVIGGRAPLGRGRRLSGFEKKTKGGNEGGGGDPYLGKYRRTSTTFRKGNGNRIYHHKKKLKDIFKA